MKIWVLVLFFTFGVLIAALQDPHSGFSPGPVLPGHKNIQDCSSCHTPFYGTEQSCQTCHLKEKVSPKILEIDNFHQNLKSSSCTTCHKEHETGKGKIIFTHSALKNPNPCSRCHTAPSDTLHNNVKSDCSSCHKNENSFHLDNFDHKILDPSVACTNCHQPPKDEIHAANSQDCSTCHTTQSFSGASFDHSKWFVFDRHHPPQCSNCHENSKSLKTWSCYGCHEHSPKKIARKHTKKGISDFDNCVECHRSGNEHDIKHNQKSH